MSNGLSLHSGLIHGHKILTIFLLCVFSLQPQESVQTVFKVVEAPLESDAEVIQEEGGLSPSPRKKKRSPSKSPFCHRHVKTMHDPLNPQLHSRHSSPADSVSSQASKESHSRSCPWSHPRSRQGSCPRSCQGSHQRTRSPRQRSCGSHGKSRSPRQRSHGSHTSDRAYSLLGSRDCR